MIYTFKKLSLFGDFNHFNQTFWGENSITAMLLFIFTSLTHPSYPFLESHKLLIIYLVTSRQLPDLCHNDLKETPRCSPGLLINLCKEIPDFTLRLTYHLCPHGALPFLFSQSKMWRHPFPLQLKSARAACALHTWAHFLVTIHPLGAPSHFSHSIFLASSVSYCFNLIRLLPTYCLQHRNYSYLYVFMHSLCSAVLSDFFFFIISFPNSPLSFLS